MSDSIAPESRIFRIGRECYVVYLGKERDDINPFLRIGNKRDIPDEVFKVISTTVVTDDHIGNPLLEILYSQKVQGRYLGDTAVVGEIRKFFRSFDLPTDEVTDYRKVKDGEKRHMVWFYSSGNIHLRYDEKVIFDLDRREKEDRHFVRLYEEAKAEFLRNPLRYIRQDFAGPGMVLSGGNAFWYEGGEMLSMESHPGFVAELMNDGVDPDFITASCYDLEADEMDSHDAAVFIGFVKRMRQRRKQLRVLTSKPELQRKLRLLFPGRGEVPATLEVTDVSGKKKATYRDSIISYRDESWRIHRAGLPEISIGKALDSGISVDVENRVISISEDGQIWRLSTPRGCPIDFLRQDVPENQVVEKYIGLIYTQLKTHFGQGETQAAAGIEKYLRMLKDDLSVGKAAASPLLKQTAGAARDGIRKAHVHEGGPSWFFYSNALTVLEILREDAGDDHPLAKNAETVISALQNLLSRIASPDAAHPFWADLYLAGTPRLLWRAAKRNYVPADIAAAAAVKDRISEITRLDEAPWQEDEERLLRLIRSLGQGGKGPLTDDQLALLKSPEEPKPKEEPKPAAEHAAAAPAAPLSSGPEGGNRNRQTGDGSGTEVAKRRDSSGGGRKGWLWLFLLLLLLIGGAVVWDLSGTAPWGSVLGRETGVDIGGPDSGSGVESDDAGDSSPAGSTFENETEDGGSSQGDGVSAGESAESAPSAGNNESGETAVASESGETAEAGSNAVADSGSGTGASGAGTADGVSFGEAGGGDDGGRTGSSIIDPDTAPRTREEVKAYLSVDGRVGITEVDIHLAANEIAVNNGFMDLDYRVYTGEDPDWIYPGNILKMPDTPDYTVKRGDTIWFLAAREVRVDVNERLAVYDRALATLDDSASSDAERNAALDSLRDISENSRAEDMRLLAANALNSKQ